MTLGEKIQISRKKKGMSQEDLANLLNVSRQAVQKWESNSSTPEIDKLVLISNAFDVSLDWLLKDVDYTSNCDVSGGADNKEVPEAIKTEKKNSEKKGISYGAIKGWMIVGIILSPLYIGGSILHATNYNQLSLLVLLLYLVTIPLGVFVLKKVKNAFDKSELIGVGVISIIFLSTIAGILILCLKDEQLPLSLPEPIKANNSPKQIVNSDKNAVIKAASVEVPLSKKKKIALISILSSIGVLLLVFIILIPTVIIPATNRQTNDPTPVNTDTRSERTKAWDTIYDDIKLYKTSDTSYSKLIYDTTNEYFDKNLSFRITINKQYSYQWGDIYLRCHGEYWLDTEHTRHAEIDTSIGIVRSYDSQSEFTGKCYFYFYNSTGSSNRYVYIYSDARHLSSFSLSNCINLYNINVSQNKTSGMTGDDLKELMLEGAIVGMSDCLTYSNSYLKSFYGIRDGLHIFGITCV